MTHLNSAKKRLSVILITKNEEQHIVECLQSVAFADEVVVLDSGSTDATVRLAEEMGARVQVNADWQGFGIQKNRALDLATGDWVLSLDADERVTPELAAEIQAVLQQADTAEAYTVPRLSCFGGKWMRHSGWWPDRILRLFKRGAARFKDVPVHESLICEAEPRALNAHLLHYTYDSLETMIGKINLYSTLAAQAQHAQGRKISLVGVVCKALWTFMRLYVVRRGFLDGKQGFMLALISSAGSLFRYAKLWFLNNNTKWKPKP